MYLYVFVYKHVIKEMYLEKLKPTVVIRIVFDCLRPERTNDCLRNHYIYKEPNMTFVKNGEINGRENVSDRKRSPEDFLLLLCLGDRMENKSPVRCFARKTQDGPIEPKRCGTHAHSSHNN
jgi:hypothetical protein